MHWRVCYLRVKKVSTETVALLIAWKVNLFISSGINVAKFSEETIVTHISLMYLPLISIGPAHFRFKDCWAVSFISIQILIEQSVNKQ